MASPLYTLQRLHEHMKPLFLAIASFVVLVTSAVIYAEASLQSVTDRDRGSGKGARPDASPPPGADSLSAQEISESGGSHLDLSASELTEIPDRVFEVTGLTVLNISHNRINGSIQPEIGKLKELRVLDASYNQMTGLPAEIGHLPNLEVLNLSNNRFTRLPRELGELRKLKKLDISGNRYSAQDLRYIKEKLPSSVEMIVK
jgi:Leucine-rich repeat (LRR) protein